MKKAIFFDIDGTLIDSHGGKQEISDKVKESLGELQRQGHYIFIATGRPYAFLSDTIKNFGFDGYVLANGANVMVNEKMIHSKAMDEVFLKSLVSMLKAKKLEYILVGDRVAYTDERHRNLWMFYNNYGIFKDQFEFDYTLDGISSFKVEVIFENQEDLNVCVDYLNDYPEYAWCHSVHPMHLEIYLKESHKATGILKILEYLNIKIENTYAFGDGSNDIEMLETVGCGIAMGNASDEVKKYANVVTDTVANDGIVFGIEKYILGK